MQFLLITQWHHQRFEHVHPICEKLCWCNRCQQVCQWLQIINHLTVFKMFSFFFWAYCCVLLKSVEICSQYVKCNEKKPTGSTNGSFTVTPNFVFYTQESHIGLDWLKVKCINFPHIKISYLRRQFFLSVLTYYRYCAHPTFSYNKISGWIL